MNRYPRTVIQPGDMLSVGDLVEIQINIIWTQGNSVLKGSIAIVCLLAPLTLLVQEHLVQGIWSVWYRKVQSP